MRPMDNASVLTRRSGDRDGAIAGEIDGENMARTYRHELAGWPAFTWDVKTLAPLLSAVRLRQGLLLGKVRGYGFTSRLQR